MALPQSSSTTNHLLTCHCLNIQLILSTNINNSNQEDENIPKEFLEYLDQFATAANNQDDVNVDDFIINSKLIKIVPNGIKMNYEYLCLKRIIDERLQVNFCAVCEKETHAIFISNNNNISKKPFSSSLKNNLTKSKINEDSLPNCLFVLAHNSLINDEMKINELKSASNYSPALGIVLPDHLIFYSDLNDFTNENNNDSNNNKDSGIGKTVSSYHNDKNHHLNNNNNQSYDNYNYDCSSSYYLLSSYIQMDVTDKIKAFLRQEKNLMQEKIKRFSLDEERRFKNLCQMTQENKNSFLRMIEAIKIRHNIDNDEFSDKENRSINEIINNSNNNTNNKINTSFDSADSYPIGHQKNNTKMMSSEERSSSFNKSINLVSKNSDEFDSIFDIDDIDISQHQQQQNFYSNSRSNDQTIMYRSNSKRIDDDDDNYDVQDDIAGDDDDDDDTAGNQDEINDDADDDDEFDLEERRDVFPVPLKESNNYSFNNNHTQSGMNENFPATSSSNNFESRRLSNPIIGQNRNSIRSFATDINTNASGGSGGGGRRNQMVASSLPIQIPHFARRMTREMEESFRINPGESIGDSIKKLARSVRNVDDILDDRPRRRDLVHM